MVASMCHRFIACPFPSRVNGARLARSTLQRSRKSTKASFHPHNAPVIQCDFGIPSVGRWIVWSLYIRDPIIRALAKPSWLIYTHFLASHNSFLKSLFSFEVGASVRHLPSAFPARPPLTSRPVPGFPWPLARFRSPPATPTALRACRDQRPSVDDLERKQNIVSWPSSARA